MAYITLDTLYAVFLYIIIITQERRGSKAFIRVCLCLRLCVCVSIHTIEPKLLKLQSPNLHKRYSDSLVHHE